VDALLEKTGFERREYFGSVTFAPFSPMESADLVALAR